MNFGHAESVALRKLGKVPDGFEFCSSEWIGTDGFLLKGSVPRTITRGKNKGRKQWSKPYLSAVVTRAEIDAERERYEAETGKCHKCMGETQVVTGWHHIEGTRRKECPRCKGSGKAPGKETP